VTISSRYGLAHIIVKPSLGLLLKVGRGYNWDKKQFELMITMTTPPLPELIIIGAEYLHSTVHHGSSKYDNFIVRVEHTENLRHHKLQEWGIVVLPYTMYLSMERQPNPPFGIYTEFGAPLIDIVDLEQQILAAWQKGRTVCFLAESLIGFPYPDDTLIKIDDVYRFFKQDDERLKSNIIGHRILRSLGASQNLDEEVTSYYQVKRGEFANYLRNFGAGSIYFTLSGSSEKADVICCDAKGNVAGFCLQCGRGNLLFLPYLRHSKLDFDEAMQTLASGIVTYLSRIATEEPEWVKSFVFAQEKPLLKSKRKLEAKIKDLDASLAPFKNRRAVLWQRDYALQDSVPRFLNELGIETRQDESFEEDFWIIQGGEDVVIAEVKGMNGNIKRQDIAKLDGHRKAREKPDDFPALLVANTFAILQDVREKNERIGPSECKRATADHILVMRTVDLINLYELIAQERLELSRFIEMLLTESGWLKVDASGWTVIKQ